MTAKKRYIVWVSNSSKIVVWAKNPRDAKQQVWEDISKPGNYRYGWESENDFMQNAETEVQYD